MYIIILHFERNPFDQAPILCNAASHSHINGEIEQWK